MNNFKTIFKENGFYNFPAILSQQELDDLRVLYEECINKFFQKDNQVTPKGYASMGTTWIFRPEEYVPSLLNHLVTARLVELATELLGAMVVSSSFRVFHKLPVIGNITPWHQDEAYQSPRYFHNTVNFWIPMEDVTVKSGCLRYLPAPINRDIVEHEAVFDFVSKGLIIQAVDVNDELSIDAELRAGDVISHHCRTLHSSRPNNSTKARRALVLVCSATPTPNFNPPPREWLKDTEVFR